MTLGRANEKDPLLKASTSFHNISYTTNNQISLSFSPFVASSCAYDDESIQSYNDLAMRKATQYKASQYVMLPKSTSASSLTSNAATMMHIIKGNVGTGILAMPAAFKHAGLAVGTAGILIIGLICIHCIHMLIKCQEILCQKLNFPFLDYEDVAEQAMANGPVKLQKFAQSFRKAVIMFLFITQFGFCCVYAFFVSDSIAKVVENLFGYHMHPNWYMLMVWPFMIALNMVRSLKHLAYASAAANILQLAGLSLVLMNLVQNLPKTGSAKLVADPSGLPLFLGTAVYAFEGIGLVLPIKKDMAEPSALGGKIGVLNTSMTVVSALYTAIGFFGFLKYGDAVSGNVAINLDPSPANEAIRIMFSVAIFFSYPLQFYVPFNILWPAVVEKYDLRANDYHRVYEFLSRAFFVTLTFMIAAIVPKLDLFISLVGSFSSSCLALIFPPIIQAIVYWHYEQSNYVKVAWCVKNVLISLFGVLIFIIGTYVAMRDIIIAFEDADGGME